MQRDFTKVLEKWSKGNSRKPLVVMGARQIGKTYIISKFCQENFKKHVMLNFADDEEALKLCNVPDFKTARNNIHLAYDIDLDDENSIIFFDEIQEAPYLIQHLKFFNINHPNAHIICAGSLLGVCLRKFEKSYPLGYVCEETMHPMTFKEFLIAIGEERYIPVIEKAYNENSAISEGIHNILLKRYREFLFMGGMPEVIQDYINNNIMNTGDLSKLNNKEIINDIISKYRTDMGKYLYYPQDEMRISLIYDSIPSQLGKENPKFTFAKLDKKDNRKDSYLTSIDWLHYSNIVNFCYLVKRAEYPLRVYRELDSYKIYYNDVGILNQMARIDYLNLMTDGDYLFKGQVAENYVANQFFANGLDLLYYSEKDKGSRALEIDFILQLNGKVIPIEVKASLNTKSKSLKSYMDKYNSDYAIRISTKNFGLVNKIKSVPLYAVFCIK